MTADHQSHLTAASARQTNGKTVQVSSALAPLVPRLGRLGHGDEMYLDPLGLLQRAQQRCGDIARLQIGPLIGHVLIRPDYVQHVLHVRQQNYRRSDTQPEHVQTMLGKGMLTANDDSWRHQRRRAQPLFRPKRLLDYTPMMYACAGDLIERWQDAAGRGLTLDLHREMIGVALRISSLAFFGVDMGDDADELVHLSEAFHGVGPQRKPTRLSPTLSPPLPLDLSRKRLEQLICHVVDRRHPGDADDSDLLGVIIKDYGGAEKAKDAKGFHDEAITLLMASHETTASALSFAFMLLTRHPDVLEELRAESSEMIADQGCTDGSGSQSYARKVVQETLRLFPPAWMIDRVCLEDDEIDGYLIPKDSLAILVPYLSHRDPTFWPDPTRFEPRRFDPEPVAKRPRHAFIPFGTGPRVCIGASFALSAATILLTSLAARFDLTLADDGPITFTANFTLRPAGPLPMTLRSLT
ncbi:MAG: cytochrome P450 [Pseudomonadota bacterium]